MCSPISNHTRYEFYHYRETKNTWPCASRRGIFLRGRNITTLYLKSVDEEEAKTTICSCKSKSSLDVDNISIF